MRRCSPEHFGSLQYVLVGAEKLPERTALAFEDIFGIRPLEGYGCTECAPVVAVNGRDFRAPGFRQVAARRGTIGHPLPGVSVRIVDPDTLEALPLNKPGMLLVKGPNVMKGYLGRPEKTAEVLKDGWYTTGDIATMEEDGFLTMKEVIEDLELNADLVALSACNTAGESAQANNGEGFAGLTRAFMYAGARSLLVSHWKIDSAATVRLMSSMFQSGQPTQGGGLQAATLALMDSADQYSHPYYWAAFTVVGDGDRPMPR